MQRSKFLKLWLPLLVLLIGQACQEDDIIHDAFVQFDTADLNEQGLAFVEALQTQEGWQKEWNEILKIGIPEPNQVLGVYSTAYDNYVVLPIINDEVITHLAFYIAGDTLKNPVIVGSEGKEYPDFVYSFFCSRAYTIWEDRKMHVEDELKNIMNNRITERKPVTKSNILTFPVTVWVTYEYLTNSVTGGKAEVERQIYNTCYTAFRYAQSRCPGISYRFPGLIYTVDILPGILNDYDAQEMVFLFLDHAMNVFLSYSFIHAIHYEYHWSPVADENGKFPDSPFGGWSESEREKEICPMCNKIMEKCICSVRLSVTISGNSTKELLEPYDITVSISGANKNNVDLIAIQMKKESGDWKSLEYGTPTNGVYKINRSSFNPGKWQIRAGYGLVGNSDVTYSSNVVTVREQWPHINAFKDNVEVVSTLKKLWDKGVDFAEQNQATHAVREFGAFIFVQPDGSYQCREVEPGPIVYLNAEGVAGSLTLVEGDYANLDDWDNPKRKIPLVVGTMHTHYPLTWAKRGFWHLAGPSKQDNDASQVWPGLVYDYSLDVKAGDPVIDSKNPLKIWTYGPERRAISK